MNKKEYVNKINGIVDTFIKDQKQYNINVTSSKLEVTEVKKREEKVPAWAKVLIDKVDVIASDVTMLKQDMIEVKQDIAILKQDVHAMKNTPTMKRELAEQS